MNFKYSVDFYQVYCAQCCGNSAAGATPALVIRLNN